ncbi:MAG: zinc-ribbon domain-containing protein [Pyrinomonadaceae bacterium]
MNNKFCNRCGQANQPNSNICTKCGASLTQGSQPNPNVQQNQPAHPGKKSNTLYWVLGIGAVLIVLFIGLIAVVGIGFLVLSSQTKETEITTSRSEKTNNQTGDNDGQTQNESDSSNDPLSDVKFPSEDGEDFGGQKSTSMDNSTLKAYFTEKKRTVGPFTLDKIETSDDYSLFPNRDAGAEAIYSSGSAKVLHRVALYSSLEGAEKDAEGYKEMVRNFEGKIISQKSDQIIWVYKGVTFLGFNNKQGGLHEISSKNSKDILTYYKAYFGE